MNNNASLDSSNVVCIDGKVICLVGLTEAIKRNEEAKAIKRGVYCNSRQPIPAHLW